MTNRILILIIAFLLAGCGTTDVYLTESYNGTSLVNSSSDSGNIFAVSNNENIRLVTSRLNSDAGYHQLKRRGFLTFFIEVTNTGESNIKFTPDGDLAVNLVNLRTEEKTALPFEVGKYVTRTFKQRLSSDNKFNREYALKLATSYRDAGSDNGSINRYDASWMLSEQNELTPEGSLNGFILVEVEKLHEIKRQMRLDIEVVSTNGSVTTQYVVVCCKYRGIESKIC